jgi:hypothetical protein
MKMRELKLKLLIVWSILVEWMIWNNVKWYWRGSWIKYTMICFSKGSATGLQPTSKRVPEKTKKRAKPHYSPPAHPPLPPTPSPRPSTPLPKNPQTRTITRTPSQVIPTNTTKNFQIRAEIHVELAELLKVCKIVIIIITVRKICMLNGLLNSMRYSTLTVVLLPQWTTK